MSFGHEVFEIRVSKYMFPLMMQTLRFMADIFPIVHVCCLSLLNTSLDACTGAVFLN